MSDKELLPCPFCGGSASWMIGIKTAYAQALDIEKSTQNTVECDNCGCTTPEWFSREKAVEAWNTRSDTLKEG